MRRIFVFLFVRLSFAAHVASPLEIRCGANLRNYAAGAEAVNGSVEVIFSRSALYADFNKSPLDFWVLSQKQPKDFLFGAADRIEKIGEFAPRYAELLTKLEKTKISKEDARKIVEIESDPLMNMILDEHDAKVLFEKRYLNTYSDKAIETYRKAESSLAQFIGPVLQLRQKLRDRVHPGNISRDEAKSLIDEWGKQRHVGDIHPDMLPDWVTGADSAVGAENKFIDPSSGHQTGYGATPVSVLRESIAELPLVKGDTVLDVGSGWGRVVMSGALSFPDINFTGVEFVPERAVHVQKQIEKIPLNNARSFQGDASALSIEPEIQKAKALFLFNSFSKPALELFLQRLKSVCSKTGETKYIVTINEQLFPFTLQSQGFHVYKPANNATHNFNRYTIYEVKP